jgi:hypothetical protein
MRQRLKCTHFTVWRADVEFNIGSLVSKKALTGSSGGGKIPPARLKEP